MSDDKIARVQYQIDNEVKPQLQSAIDKTIERGDRLDDLENKAQDLEVRHPCRPWSLVLVLLDAGELTPVSLDFHSQAGAERFHRAAKKLKWSMLCQSWKHTAIIAFIIIVFFILFLWAVGAFKDE